MTVVILNTLSITSKRFDDNSCLEHKSSITSEKFVDNSSSEHKSSQLKDLFIVLDTTKSAANTNDQVKTVDDMYISILTFHFFGNKLCTTSSV